MNELKNRIKRGKINYEGGKWDIPGGTVEPMELPSDAAVREAKEEVGLNIKILSILYEKSNIDLEKNTVFTTLIYRCKVINNYYSISLDTEEHDTYRWVTQNDILAMNDNSLVSYMKELIQCL
ncbi:hydrolase, NUDIX family [Anaeromyces robustus]|uniref:Hydrolase, NUDIX family n=1 Tax=Anaeromyces robustus TaxID=1754192 RepID=A0A1Y1X6C4_9FUNG|nr:hydrolase, NUDIX family [Anaeromyces robustus]|eukprot:ORX81357.1 hydrolase, NUDIX family [Anaeromyces robustus]